jgi:hypothetical protein
VDLKDESMVEIVNSSADFWSYVTSFNDRLYYTDSRRNDVVCCDINGTILWTFIDTSVRYTNCVCIPDDKIKQLLFFTDNQHCIKRQISLRWQLATALFACHNAVPVDRQVYLLSTTIVLHQFRT